MRLLLVGILLFCSTLSWAGEGRIYAQRVSASGAAIGSPIVISNSAPGTTQSRPNVSFYNDRYLVVWQQWNGTDLDVKGARLSMDGAVLDTTPINIHSGPRNQSLPDVAGDTLGWMTVWSAFDGISVTPSVFAGRVDYDGTVQSTPIKFGVDPYASGLARVGYYPRIAWHPAEGKHLVTFTGLSSTAGTATWSARLTTAPVATVGTQLLYHATSSDVRHPVAAMPGGGWTMTSIGTLPGAWGTYSIAAAIHIEPTGLLDTEGYVSNGSNLGSIVNPNLLDNNLHPWGGTDVATDANHVIGVWTRYSVGGPQNLSIISGDLYAARIDQWNPVEDIGGTLVSGGSASECWPSLAGNGAGSLLLVYDKQVDGSTEIASRVLTVDVTGIASSAETILRTDATGKRRSQSAVAYGDNGAGSTGYLVVWTEGWWGAL